MKYKMVLKTEPSKHTYTKEEVNQKIDKAINILLDDLILNGHLKIGE
jgi:predicted RNase H-like HicB family nuclease